MSDTPFVRAELTVVRDGARASAKWSERGVHQASADLIAEPKVHVDRSWDHEPAAAAEGQSALAEVRAAPPPAKSASPIYTLAMVDPAKAEKTLQWDDTTETPALARVRKYFDREGHLAFVLATAYRQRAAILVEQGQLEPSIAPLKAGIEVLGSYYFRPNTLDSTGMKLVLAQTSEQKGELEIARNVYTSVLDARLATYAAAL